MGESQGNGSTTRNEHDWSLDELRDEIEEIDDDIVDLIARRTYVAESIVEAKRENGMEIHDPDREEEVFDRVARKAERLELDPDAVREVFEVLVEMNKQQQRRFRD